MVIDPQERRAFRLYAMRCPNIFLYGYPIEPFVSSSLHRMLAPAGEGFVGVVVVLRVVFVVVVADDDVVAAIVAIVVADCVGDDVALVVVATPIVVDNVVIVAPFVVAPATVVFGGVAQAKTTISIIPIAPLARHARVELHVVGAT